MFFGRNDAEAETPIFWPPHVKSWLIGKDPDAWRYWGQEEKWTTEDEMAGWHHPLYAHEFGWTPGVGDGQGGLECCDSWGHKESDSTEWLNWTELCSIYIKKTDNWPTLIGYSIDRNILPVEGLFIYSTWLFRWSYIHYLFTALVNLVCSKCLRLWSSRHWL